MVRYIKIKCLLLLVCINPLFLYAVQTIYDQGLFSEETLALAKKVVSHSESEGNLLDHVHSNVIKMQEANKLGDLPDFLRNSGFTTKSTFQYIPLDGIPCLAIYETSDYDKSKLEEMGLFYSEKYRLWSFRISNIAGYEEITTWPDMIERIFKKNQIPKLDEAVRGLSFLNAIWRMDIYSYQISENLFIIVKRHAEQPEFFHQGRFIPNEQYNFGNVSCTIGYGSNSAFDSIKVMRDRKLIPGNPQLIPTQQERQLLLDIYGSAHYQSQSFCQEIACL